MTRVLCGGGVFGVMRSIWLTVASVGFLLVLGSPHPSFAQAVYGSITGVIIDNSGGALPGVTVTVTSVERKTVDSVVTNDSGRFVKERLLPGEYEVKAEMTGFKTALVPNVRVSVDTQTPIDMQLEVGALDRSDHRHRRRSAAQDRSRRCVDDVRDGADYVAADSRSQRDEVPAADAGHATTRLAARGQRESARIGADSSQRAALQRHRLSARRHAESRPHPRHHRHQSHLRVDAGDEDHLAELRRRVRRDGGCGLHADEVRHQQFPRQRVRVLSRRTLRRAQSVHAADARCAAGHDPQSVRRIGRRPDPAESPVLLRRLRRHALEGRRIAAADGADGSGAQR